MLGKLKHGDCLAYGSQVTQCQLNFQGGPSSWPIGHWIR